MTTTKAFPDDFVEDTAPAGNHSLYVDDGSASKFIPIWRILALAHRIGLASARPAATATNVGFLYYSTDTLLLERSNGTTWDTYGGGGSLPDVGTPGTYGAADTVPVITTDSKGRVSAVTDTSIQITETQVTNLLYDLGTKVPQGDVESSGLTLAGPGLVGLGSGTGAHVERITLGSGLAFGGDYVDKLYNSDTGSSAVSTHEAAADPHPQYGVRPPVGTSSGDTGQISFKELAANGSNKITIKAPDALAADLTITLPSVAPGAAADCLVATTAGVASWSARAVMGANTFNGIQTIDLGSAESALPAVITTTSMRVAATTAGVQNTIEYLAWNGGAAFYHIGRATGGSRATPAATANNQYFARIGCYGHDGTSYLTALSATFGIQADGTFSSTNHGVKYIFAGVSNGSTSLATWVTVQNAQMGVGVAPTTGNGIIQMATGTTKADGIAWDASTNLYMTASGALKTDSSLDVTGNLKTSAVGSGLYVKEGTNATMGVATLVAGVVVVSTTKVTANSRILLTPQTLGTITLPAAVGVTARAAGTSFTITSTAVTDTSTVAWVILEPA